MNPERDFSDLDPRFTPFYKSGEQVEVEFEEGHEIMIGSMGCKTGGKKIRFYVGRSRGWKPIYIMLLKRNSSGGMALFSTGIKSIRGTGKYLGRK